MNEYILSQSVSIETRPGIYYLLRKNKVVYVGQTVNLYQRIGVHISRGRIKFDAYSFAACPEDVLDFIEACEIVEHMPIHNKSLPPNHRYMTIKNMRDSFGMSIRQIKKHIKSNNLEPLIIGPSRYYDTGNFT